MPHSELYIKLDLPLPADPQKTRVKMEIKGCHEHLIEAITECLVDDQVFRQIYNEAGKRANLIRQGKNN